MSEFGLSDKPVTFDELVRIVQEMRNAQREYFRTRMETALDAAKVAERRVDHALKEIADKQPRLF